MGFLVKDGKKGLKLNLGCGTKKMKGFINCDINPYCKPDKIIDLNKKWPVKDSSVNEIYAEMVLEHMDDLNHFFDEVYRVCKNKARVIIRVPFFSSYHNYSDPTHKHKFNHLTLNYFNRGRFLIDSKICFGEGKIGKIINFLFSPIANLNKDIYCRFFAYIFPAMEIKFYLRVIKNDNQ